jgi:hypothetical protein
MVHPDALVTSHPQTKLPVTTGGKVVWVASAVWTFSNVFERSSAIID